MAFRNLFLNRNRIPHRMVSSPLCGLQLGGSTNRCSMAVSRMLCSSSYQLLRRFLSPSTDHTAASSSSILPSVQSLRVHDFKALYASVSLRNTVFDCDYTLSDQHHQQRRYKHSSTQIKRLFRKNPARLRVEKRMWNIDRKQPQVLIEDDESHLRESTDVAVESTNDSAPVELAAHAEEGSEPLPPQSLLYPRVYTPPAKLPNGWFEPMDPALRPTYPFTVTRTKNKPKDSIGFLPIYTKYRYVLVLMHRISPLCFIYLP